MTTITHETNNPELNLGKLLQKHSELQIDHQTYNINVTSNHGISLSPEDLIKKYVAHNGMGKPAHLYFHVPLCAYICHFCNYVKQLAPKDQIKANEEYERWANLLVSESSRYLAQMKWIRKAKIESFYLGGGTAALLLRGGHITKILEHVWSNYDIADNCEISLEGNPDNYQGDQVEYAQSLGFNRFSVGVQSLQDEVNAFVKRGHDSQSSILAIDNLLKSGCPFNVDMMFGLPYQTEELVEKDILTLVKRKVPTITIYRLRNSDRAAMGIGNSSVWNSPQVMKRLQEEERFPGLEMTYRMRERAVRVLMEYGYSPSPCGWWSAPSTYPDGNIPRVSRNKWQRYDTMIAFGPGAYGWLAGGNDYIVQTHNETNISKYEEIVQSSDDELPLAFGRVLEGNVAIGASLGFAFKANQPISLERYRQQFGIDLMSDEPYAGVIKDLLDGNLLKLTEEGGTALKPTFEGEALHEEIISVYMHGKIGGFSAEVCRRFSGANSNSCS